jgi:ATP-dependent DNA helicase RecG
MAPTEVLARQHESTLREILANSRVRIALLTGSTAAKDRARVTEEMAIGGVDIVVGTHALVRGDSRFAKLGLVVIDEQHKFGVQQRAGLRQGTCDPHCLVMTATPIPRTVSMTLYGDLDVSLLRQGPPGRQPVRTYWANESQRQAWWQFFRRKLGEGRQGYVIAPLVDDEAEDSRGAEQLLEHLANTELANYRIDLLHGRLTSRDKQLSLDAFRQGRTQVLVATSAVEVGIDVPNASVMTIEHADRFGLSQLHQLRGRVGRGAHPGFVCLFAESKSELTSRRLEALVRTNDGFELAETDFQLRGPGELFGTKQHGSSPFVVADLQRDQQIVERARRDAQEIIHQDPDLSSDPFALLKRRVLAKYGRDLNLGDVG